MIHKIDQMSYYPDPISFCEIFVFSYIYNIYITMYF